MLCLHTSSWGTAGEGGGYIFGDKFEQEVHAVRVDFMRKTPIFCVSRLVELPQNLPPKLCAAAVPSVKHKNGN